MIHFLEDKLYLVSVLCLVPLWTLFFLSFKGAEDRKELLKAGVIFGFLSIYIDFMYAWDDYWSPSYIFGKKFPFEDFLYGFVYGGIGMKSFCFFFKRKIKKQPSFKVHKHVTKVLVVLILLIMYVFIDVLKINSIYIQISILLSVGLLVAYYRPDLIIPSLLNALIVTFLTFVWQRVIIYFFPLIIEENWKLENLSNIFLFSVPIEELLFAFALGLAASNYYKFKNGFGMIKKD